MGYTFNTWNTAADGSGTTRATAGIWAMGSANVTLYAQWNRIQDTLLIATSIGGTTTPASGTTMIGDSGSSRSISATAGAGYAFKVWRCSSSATTPYYGLGRVDFTDSTAATTTATLVRSRGLASAQFIQEPIFRMALQTWIIDTSNTSRDSAISTGGAVATWSATGRPAGINIDATTGALYGKPADTCHATIVVSGVNAAGTKLDTVALVVRYRSSSTKRLYYSPFIMSPFIMRAWAGGWR
jgi:uncharacterized repeat protein (TIGR02543 family)